jgi:hypothetical protein
MPFSHIIRSKKKKQKEEQKESLERGVEAAVVESAQQTAEPPEWRGKTAAEIAFLRAQRERVFIFYESVLTSGNGAR